MSAALAFALVSAAHAGFQVTVSVLVYPALVRVGPEAWEAAHLRHSRAVVPLVAVLYGGLVGTGAWLVVSGPGALGWVGLAGAVVALVVTATLAAPIHARLSATDDALRRRLVRVDVVRCLGAGVGAVAAASAVLS